MILACRCLVVVLTMCAACGSAHAQQKKPNILVVWGDDIGQFNGGLRRAAFVRT